MILWWSIQSSLANPPTSYIRDRVLGCIFDDETGLANRDRVGMELIAFETDYPHADSTFPKTKEVATTICENAGLSEQEIYALMRGNAIRAFGLSRWGIVE